ncbi:ribonuclease H-like domain-containing protein [Tanacetum coccineum]|uniref:Ribonuclease H-like domain-containing protein n=1 Tax=Tanacetum coccineum TaxID=301880 RepID=A0ABQ5I617_9ASTR
MNGHTTDRCFELVGYPPKFKKRNGTNQGVASNVVVSGSKDQSSVSSFTDKHYKRLIALISEKSRFGSIPANVAGHPNGTKAVVTHIGSLRLADKITINDVLVVPDYQVSLLSVHKLSKHNKFRVIFDEDVCIIKDSVLRTQVGTGGSEIEKSNDFTRKDEDGHPNDSDVEENAILEENDKESEGDDSYYQEFNDLFQHVDDIVITRNDLNEINKVKEFLKTKFLVKDLGKLKYFLGIEVLESDSSLILTQRKYCLELLSEFGILACKPCKTPIEVKTSSVEKNVVVLNEPLVLSEASWESHFKLAFKVLRYLRNSPDKGITFNKSSSLDLNVYVDSDRAKCKVTKKIRDWIAANRVFHERTKHSEIELFFLREKVVAGIVKAVKVKSEDNVADVLNQCCQQHIHNLNF